jgi:hypothetical protein
VDTVVVLVVLIDTGVGLNGGWEAETLTTIVAGGTTHRGATLRRLPSTLERSAEGREGRGNGFWQVLILVLEIDGVVILVELIHIGVEMTGHGLAEFKAAIVSRGTTHGDATVGTRESLGSVRVVRTAARATHGSTTLLRVETLLKRLRGRVENCRRRARGSVEFSTGRATEVNRGLDCSNRRWVNVGVLDINRVVILIVVIDLSVEDSSDWHIEALAFIVARGPSHGSTARGAALPEWTHARDLRSLDHRRTEDSGSVVWTGIHILVLHVDRVVIFVPLVDLGVGFDAGGIRTDKAAVTIISGWATHGGATILSGWEAMFLTQN